jgi:hypothetical protein
MGNIARTPAGAIALGLHGKGFAAAALQAYFQNQLIAQYLASLPAPFASIAPRFHPSTLQRSTATVEIGPTEPLVIGQAFAAALRILKVDRANLAADLPTGEVSEGTQQRI